MDNPEQAANSIIKYSAQAFDGIEVFSREVLQTRGGRIGSGMGTLLEALWGFYINQALSKNEEPIELGWLIGHEYNDFACVFRNSPWNPIYRTGELLRVEVKTMNAGADESKAHFDAPAHLFGERV